MFDWDDLRVFLAAARAGSLATAAQRLGVDAATVGRRVARLETALKSTLLVRSAAGLHLTATGAQLLERALDAESAMEAAGRVTQPDLIAGAVRISASEGFGGAIRVIQVAEHQMRAAVRDFADDTCGDRFILVVEDRRLHVGDRAPG